MGGAHTMTAETIARQLHGRRSGAGFVANCPVHEGDGRTHRPSLSVRERGGVVLVHCFAGCSQSDVIMALRTRGLWPERERKDWTPADKARWARERREFERDLPSARLWRRSAMRVCEELLAPMKARLFDATVNTPFDPHSVIALERALTRLRTSADASLVTEYREQRASNPALVRGMVAVMRHNEENERRALVEYLRATELEDAA